MAGPSSCRASSGQHHKFGATTTLHASDLARLFLVAQQINPAWAGEIIDDRNRSDGNARGSIGYLSFCNMDTSTLSAPTATPTTTCGVEHADSQEAEYQETLIKLMILTGVAADVEGRSLTLDDFYRANFCARN